MLMSYNEYDPFYDDKKATDTIYVSKRNVYNGYKDEKEKVRYVEEILGAEKMCGLLKQKKEATLHVTDGGRQKIKATLYEYEDGVNVNALHIARINTSTGNPFQNWQACFWGEQIQKLYMFLSQIVEIDYSNPLRFQVKKEDYNSNDDVFDKTVLQEFENELKQLLDTIKDNKTKIEVLNDLGLDINDLYALKDNKEKLATIEEFRYRLENTDIYREDKGNDNWQEWFQDKKWLFGNEISHILDVRKTDHTCVYDYLVESCEGFIDLIEIKDPKIEFWASNKDHNNYIPSTDLTKAIIQSITYIHELEIHANDKKITKNVGNILKPRCTLIIGRSNKWNEEQFESFRILNSSYHNINIITYDMLLKRAENIFAIKQNVNND